MQAFGFFEALVIIYRTSRCHNPERGDREVVSEFIYEEVFVQNKSCNIDYGILGYQIA
jgi:hypothetical protein